MKTIASFDIGIKNLAVCVINSDKEILHWDVINTLEPDLECHCCNKCKKIATVSTTILPLVSENKKSVVENEIVENEIVETVKSDETVIESVCVETDSVDEIIDVKESVEKMWWWCLTHDPEKKTRTKKELDKFKKSKKGKKVKSFSTQELNYKIILALDKLPYLLKVDEVIIELQPRINPKMKQISQTVYSYFLIRGMVDTKNIQKVIFVSAKNKLKIARSLYIGPEIECKLKGAYAQRKFYSKIYTKWLLRDNEKANTIMEQKKVKLDDLCDCYLQAIWYIVMKF